MAMKAALEAIATLKGWKFKHGRRDYIQMDQSDVDNPMNIASGEYWVILDPVQNRPVFDSEGNRVENRYSGQFMFLTKSDIGESYDTKTTNYIDPVKTELATIGADLMDQCLEIDTWQEQDGINMLFENADGVIVTYSVIERL